MRTSRRMLIAVTALLGACAAPAPDKPAVGPGPQLGRVASADEVRTRSISVAPDGRGLPAGRDADAVRTVGSYWPYATTLFDYVRRAMPTTAPMSLSNDEVYAVTAYVLNLNGIVPADAVLDARTLAQVRMPNRDGFIDYSRR